MLGRRDLPNDCLTSSHVLIAGGHIRAVEHARRRIAAIVMRRRLTTGWASRLKLPPPQCSLSDELYSTMTEKAPTGFDECVGVTRFLMKAIGVWPLDDARSLETHCKFLSYGISLLFILLIPQTGKVIRDRDDFNMVMTVLTTADIINTVVLIKLLVLWYNRLDLKKLVCEIARDWERTSAKEQRVMWSNAKLSKWAVILIWSASTGSTIAHFFLFFTSTASIYRNSTIEKSLFVESYFPFDTNYSPLFEIICCCQFICALLDCVAFSAFDGFLVCAVLHFSGQLHNLKHRFRNLVTEDSTDAVAFTKSLKYAVLRHQHLVSYTDLIEKTFNRTFLVQIFATSIALCLQGFQFVMIISESGTKLLASLIFIVVYTMGNGASLFLYCYVAQSIRDESEDLFHAIYEMSWYDVAPKDAAMLVIILSRCSTPVQLTVGKFAIFSLEYFAKVVKTSFGYLSVLLAVRQKITD